MSDDEAFDPLAHIDPRSPTFYRDAATAAAYLIAGEGPWAASGRCVLTAAIMHHAMQAAREGRAASLFEVHSALIEAAAKSAVAPEIIHIGRQKHENDATVGRGRAKGVPPDSAAVGFI